MAMPIDNDKSAGLIAKLLSGLPDTVEGLKEDLLEVVAAIDWIVTAADPKMPKSTHFQTGVVGRSLESYTQLIKDVKSRAEATYAVLMRLPKLVRYKVAAQITKAAMNNDPLAEMNKPHNQGKG